LGIETRFIVLGEVDLLLNYMAHNPKLAFINEAVHLKSVFIYEAICVENEIKCELKTNTITYPSHHPHQQK